MIRKLLAAAFAAAVIATTAALGQNAPTPPSAPLYQVEVLIFANREFDRTEEQFAHELPPIGSPTLRAPVVIDESSFDPLALRPPAVELTPEGLAPPVADDEPESGVRTLRPEELTLTAEYQKLARLPAYRVLAHGGWVQPTLPESQALPFDLAQLGISNPAGTIRLHLSRFLHLRVDLTYQDTSAVSAAEATTGLREVEVAPRYRLLTERQTRSGSLQYFDHPAFGVLVKIAPVPATPTPASGRPAA